MAKPVIFAVDDDPAVLSAIERDLRTQYHGDFRIMKGLGLDVVRRLLQRHDAEISVESEPGHTEFQVRLPASDQHA